MAVREVDHKELEMHIKVHYEAGIPLYIWGGTGVGKSETVDTEARKIAQSAGRIYVKWNELTKEEKHKVAETPEKYFFLMDIRLSQLDPSDLRGLPSLNGKDVCEWKIPFWLSVVCKPDAMGIVFFDEINLAPHSLQSAAYQLILDRELGEVAIANGVSLLAAGNRLEDRANVYDLPRPLQNRFDHVTLKSPGITQECKGDWGEWALNNGVDMRIVSFLIQRPTLLNPKISSNSNENAFPTPRSWGKYCNRLIQGITDTQMVYKLASVSIGTAAASEFESFLRLQRKIDLNDILAHPEKAGDIQELDLQYSLLALVAEWYAKNHKPEHLEKVLQISNCIQAEFAILLLRFAKLKHPSSFKNNATKLKSWRPIAKKYQKYLLS